MSRRRNRSDQSAKCLDDRPFLGGKVLQPGSNRFSWCVYVHAQNIPHRGQAPHPSATPTTCACRHLVAQVVGTARYDTEPTGARRALDHFEIPATFRLAPSSQLLSRVRRIDPDLFETWVQWSESGEQAPSPFPIVQISGSDMHSQEKTKRIDENVALASFHAFVCIEPADPGRFLNSLDALRIHDRCARVSIPPDSLT